jgi:hydroxypyruvate isomerase
MPQLSVCVEMVFADEQMEERVALAADAGADAIEFWGWKDKDLDAVAAACAEHDVDLAAMLGSDAPLTDPDGVDEAAADLRESIATAADVGCPNLIVTVGQEREDLDRDAQHEAIVSVLDRVADDAEDADVTLGLEPLNTAVDHPGYYLTSSDEGYEIVEAVDSPAVKLLFDVYHQQITEGNVTENLTGNLDHVGYVHIADVPGRHEPGTGEINYPNVLAALADAGYDGYVGCEFRPEGDHAAAVENCRDMLDR